MTAQPELREGRGINPIWVIPALALGLGIYLVIHAWLTEGPEITIVFARAEGLVAGKTRVKYRDVEMGTVTGVRLTDDFQNVEAQVKMDYAARSLLRPDTRFWLVTARVGLGNITGLDTLLSGAYIEMAPGNDKEAGTRRYKGLPDPPLTPIDAPGIRLNLLSDHAGSVSTGNAVLYKGYRVGRVETAELDPERQLMRYVVFIDAPYHELIDSAVRFWNTSGVAISTGADGVRVRTGSLDTVLRGGIAFERPPNVATGLPVESGAEFRLFDSIEAARENPYRFGTNFVVMFSQSLKGLLPGAPVEYRGIRIGHVERLMVREMMTEASERLRNGGVVNAFEDEGRPIPVLIYLEPGRISLPDSEAAVELLQVALENGVSAGLRASLDTGNLLTGAKYVNLDYYPDATLSEAPSVFKGYDVIPTLDSGIEQIVVKVNTILDKVNSAPIEETLTNANNAMKELERVLAGLGDALETEDASSLPAQLNETMESLSDVLKGLSPGTELYQNLNEGMRQLNRAMANLETLTETLSDQPNAVLVGSRLPEDPEPEAPKSP
ncbi:MAG: intermembrane transport protein PqiB [Pseudomonadota bacterium]